MDDSWYGKLAKAGWLGTAPQVDQQLQDNKQKGAQGSMDYDKSMNLYGQAIKNVAKKQKPDESAGT